MREDKVLVQVDGFLVVLGSFGELVQDEVELSPVVIDIRVLVVLFFGFFEVFRRGSLIACMLLVAVIA